MRRELRRIIHGPTALVALLLSACGARTGLDDGPRPGEQGGAGGQTSCVHSANVFALHATLRDFSDAHPDFEQGIIADDKGIVKHHLGSDDTPVYAHTGPTKTTNGPATFVEWFHDVDGVNLSTPFQVNLAFESGAWSFGDDEFFPLDGLLLGNEGRPHNYHFTLEAHARFQFRSGEVLRFEGDDDVFAFIGGVLVLDLGGVHGSEAEEVSLDDVADEIGLEKGHEYPFDFFFAERQTSGSTFHLELDGFDLCQP